MSIKERDKKLYDLLIKYTSGEVTSLIDDFRGEEAELMDTLKRLGYIWTPTTNAELQAAYGDISKLNYKVTDKGWDFIHRINLQSSQTFTNNLLIALTAILAIGALVASWYYGIEIWKFYHPHCDCH